jgi:hypothetical protein
MEPRRKSPWDGNKTERAVLRMQVWEMRRAGTPLRDVASTLGISRGFAATLEAEELDLMPAEAREMYRAHMEERVGIMQRAVIEMFAKDHDWNAFKAYQWTEERLAKLLGLDAPVVTKSEVTNRDPMDAALADVIAEAKAAEEVARARATE